MEASTEATSATTILDLNDDCMQETFKYLNLLDLCSVADVNTRFRQNAQAYFAYSKYKDFSILDPEYNSYAVDWSQLRQLLMSLTSKVLRNFGPFIRSIVASSLVYQRQRPPHEVFDMIDCYCSEALVQLHLEDYNLLNERLARERPLFRHIQRLKLLDCVKNDLFLSQLALWSPNLREIELVGKSYEMIEIVRLNQTFPNLVAISMAWCKVTQNALDEFLECNPQLKKIDVKHNKPSYNIFRSIAKYVPEIEEIRFANRRGGNEIVSEYFGQMRKLNSLELNISYNRTFIPSAFSEISTSKIPLEHLNLIEENVYGDNRVDGKKLCDNISKLETLKTLRMDVIWKRSSNNILHMCTQLMGLTELHLFYVFIGAELDITRKFLMELIRILENLEVLGIHVRRHGALKSKICIDTDTYSAMVTLAKKRGLRTHLKIDLSGRIFTANISSELVRVHKETVTVTIVP